MKKERYLFDIAARIRTTDIASGISDFLLGYHKGTHGGQQQADDLMALLYLAKVRSAGLGVDTKTLVNMAEKLFLEHDDFLAALEEERRLQRAQDVTEAQKLLQEAKLG